MTQPTVLPWGSSKHDKYGFPEVDQMLKDIKDPDKLAERKRKKEIEDEQDDNLTDHGL